MKKILSICLSLATLTSMAVSAHAADYKFETDPAPDYYKSTNYADRYATEYNYGGRNQIDYEIPEIKFGLSQEFLEHSPGNPYLGGNIQYGQHGNTNPGSYPTPDFSSSIGGGPIELPYQPSVSLDDLKQKDGSIGSVSISRVGLSCKIYEGATNESMRKGAGHYAASSLWTGNVGLFGHNRGSYGHFRELKDVRVGDIVTYKTNVGTRTYKVNFVGRIASTDYSYLNEMGDNRMTLITCVANQPTLRLCVQAKEIA